MALSRHALRMTVFTNENDQFRRRPVYTEIVHRAHAAGLAGASVVRGCEGYGSSSRIHTSRILSLSEGLPVLIVIVDQAERVRAFVPQVTELVTDGLIVLDPVEVVHAPGGADSAGISGRLG